MAALRRRPLTRTALRQTLLIICAGDTEATYFSALKSHPLVREKFHLTVRCANGGNQVETVRWADSFMRIGATPRSFDEVWCVFDLEQPPKSPSFHEAVALAARRKFSVSASNPCFELWLLLHFQDCKKPYLASLSVSQELGALWPNGAELNQVEWVRRHICGQDFDRCRQAVERAKRCYGSGLSAQTIAQTNPSTDVSLLVERLVRA